MPPNASDANDASDADCIALVDYLIEPEREWLAGISPADIPSSSLEGMVKDREGGEDAPPPTGLALRERWFGFLGNVVWDIFSGNHDVLDAEERTYSLGSWRGSGHFIADYFNARLVAEADADIPAHWGPFGYMDFYMGAGAFQAMAPDQSLLNGLYVRIFTRLKARDCEWRFSPPSLGVIRFSKGAAVDDPATYDPSRALADEAGAAEKKAAEEKMDREIAASNAKAFEEAVENPPPIVLAYVEAFGRRPRYN